MFLKLKNSFLPDEIWLSGTIYLSKFKKQFSKFIKIKVLGSTRKLILPKTNNKVNLKKNTTLVIPEGFYSSTYDLMKFCINYCSKYSNIHKFILRVHPELNKNVLFKKYPELIKYKNSI